MTASARFFQPALYLELASHAQTLLSRMIASGSCTLGMVQAIIIMVYWKRPTDKTAWIKLGIAMRLGYQLGLHIPRAATSSTGDASLLAQRDMERTWYCE
jgi:hypothetical protein